MPREKFRREASDHKFCRNVEKIFGWVLVGLGAFIALTYFGATEQVREASVIIKCGLPIAGIVCGLAGGVMATRK